MILMEKLTIEDYVARIANATPLQLVIITYELIIKYIDDAVDCIDNDKMFEFNLNKARAFLDDLRNSLDMSFELSRNLMALYNYVGQQISYYTFNKKSEHIEEAKKIISDLLVSWKTIQDKEEDKTPLMENTQQLYAGLTYDKRGKLSEYVDTDARRGFKA